jgi:hypothetical protein
MRSLDGIFIEHVEVNQPIDDTVFRMPVERGALVVDYRPGGPQPDAFHSPENLSDVTALHRDRTTGDIYIEGRLAADTDRPGEARTSGTAPGDNRWKWLVGLNAFAILSFGLIYRFSRSRRRSTS